MPSRPATAPGGVARAVTQSLCPLMMPRRDMVSPWTDPIAPSVAILDASLSKKLDFFFLYFKLLFCFVRKKIKKDWKTKKTKKDLGDLIPLTTLDQIEPYVLIILSFIHFARGKKSIQVVFLFVSRHHSSSWILVMEIGEGNQ